MRTLMAAAFAFSLLTASAARADDVKIINDPSSLEWEYYGNGYTLKPVRDPSIPEGAAVEFDVQKGQNPWSFGTNIHLTQPFVRGHTYVVRFWARTLAAKATNGRGRIIVRFLRNADPYPGFGDTTVDVGPDWRAYEVSSKATIDAPADQAVLAMQLASIGQTLQIGQTMVAEGATTLEGYKTSVAPAPDPLPPAIADKGVLLNDPTNRNWVTYGKLLTASATTTDVYTRKATLLSVSAASTNSFDAGANAPIHGAIAKGDNLIVAVLARTRSAATADGLGVIQLRMQSNQAPYPGTDEQTIKLSANWRLYQWHLTSAMDLPADKGEVAVHAGTAKQDVEIGPVYVLKVKTP